MDKYLICALLLFAGALLANSDDANVVPSKDEDEIATPLKEGPPEKEHREPASDEDFETETVSDPGYEKPLEDGN